MRELKKKYSKEKESKSIPKTIDITEEIKRK